ncbi:hypothetical protein V6N13_022016 [Hibiscus sabdariffa]
MVTTMREWDRSQFSNFLPSSLVLRIAAIKPPCVLSLDGVPAWCWDPLRSFLVRSSYRTLAGSAAASDDKGWSLIASFKASDPSCSSYGATLEDALHVLWDCPVAVGFRSMVIKPELLDEFFSLTLREWLVSNLEGNCRFPRNTLHWGSMFGYILWNLWTQRNIKIFDVEKVIQDSILLRCHRIVSQAVGSELQRPAAHVVITSGRLQRSLQRWSPPPVGWVTCNADGSFRAVTGGALGCTDTDTGTDTGTGTGAGTENGNLQNYREFIDPPNSISSLVLTDVLG